MAPLLVGLDVGTSASKAVVFTDGGQPVGQGSAATPWTRTRHGVELDAGELLASACEALERALDGAPAGTVAALGGTSMGESGVLLDGNGTPLTPIIAWHDQRDEHEIAQLAATIEADRFARHTGLPMRGQWSLTKHRWLLEHHPRAGDAVRRLNVAEWIVRRLGGVEATEQSLASRTGWLELGSRRWWPEALDWSGASDTLMPDLVTAGTPLGKVAGTAGIPRLTDATLTVAGHDHQAAAVGAGAAGPGDELDSSGTAEALVRTVHAGLPPSAVAALAADGITTGWHVLPERWCLLGGTQGGLDLQQVLTQLGRTSNDLPELDQQVPSGEENAAGAAWRAALQSVTNEARRIHTAMSGVVGPHQAFIVTGGWARSQALLAVKRRAFGPLTHAPVAEAGARGAALLAGRAAGVYAGPEDFPLVATRPDSVSTHSSPRPRSTP